MLNWFKQKAKALFSSSDKILLSRQKRGSKKTTSSTSAVPYNPNLVPLLKIEHQQLLSSYKTILIALEKQEFLQMSQQLNEFDQLLRKHLLKEHVELYVYLEYTLMKGTQAFDKMHQLRLEMEQISSNIMAFLNVYQAMPVNFVTAAEFKRNFEQIGEILNKRISREETILYPLYKKAE